MVPILYEEWYNYSLFDLKGLWHHKLLEYTKYNKLSKLFETNIVIQNDQNKPGVSRSEKSMV